MLDKIQQILSNCNEITAYKIIENKIESNELFFVKKELDMDRAKKVHSFQVTVYKDFEENDTKYRGSSTLKIHPTMTNEEIKKAITDAAFAASFVKNPYYPLVKPNKIPDTINESKFFSEPLPAWMSKLTKVIYKNDNFEKGCINSCELFLDKVYKRIINSEGIDVEFSGYKGMTEFITTWKEDGEEIELYKCLDFSDFNNKEISDNVLEMLNVSKEKAIATPTPILDKINILLTGEPVKELLSYYSIKSDVKNVYDGLSTWKIGDNIQGDSVTGDSINLLLDPFMENSTNSTPVDDDGLTLEPVTVMKDGILKSYWGDTRYSSYLNIKPTGSIKNICIDGGNVSVDSFKKEPHLELVAFSDFQTDPLTGNFGGEIRLGWYFDGEKTTPVTGGSISGNINKVQNELYLSKEMQKINNFKGPKTIKLLNVNISGIK